MRKFFTAFLVLSLLSVLCTAAFLPSAVFFAPYEDQLSYEDHEYEQFIVIVEQLQAGTNLTVTFSHNDHFYNDPILVELSTNQNGANIYYTLDGSDPSINGIEYTAPVFIGPAFNECTVLKSVAKNETESSAVVTHSYFVWEGVGSRFSDDLLIFSLSTDPAVLYDYDDGILVRGRQYDAFMEADPDNAYVREYERPANFAERGRESERPTFVETFEANSGQRVIAQTAGLRVNGNVTRYYEQKSLRLTARNEYEAGMGRFRYELFPGHGTADGYNSPFASYDSLILSTGGNDLPRAMVRTPLLTSIAYHAGFSDTYLYRPASVFINGEYYGMAWVTTNFDEDYLGRLYQTNDKDFEIVYGGHNIIWNVHGKIPTERIEFAGKYYDVMDQYYTSRGTYTDTLYEYVDFLRMVEDEGLLDDANLEIFTEMFDVDNYLFYYALEYYLGNTDWPSNNQKLWRYTGEEKGDGPLDGRYRFLLFDLDLCWTADTAKTLDEILETSTVFRALMEREEMRAKFLNYICDLAHIYSYDKVFAQKENLTNASLQEIDMAFSYGVFTNSSQWEMVAKDWESVNDRWATYYNEHAVIMENAKNRFIEVTRELRDLYGFNTARYEVIVAGPAKINLYNEGYGHYYIDSEVTLFPALEKNQHFEYWLVNGQQINEEILLVSSAFCIDGVVQVELVYREEEPAVRFASAYDDGDICGFVLENISDEKISLQGLFLSDKSNDLTRYPIGNITMSSGLQLEFVGSSYAHNAALFKILLNFNPRSGETIFLSDADGNVLDYITVP